MKTSFLIILSLLLFYLNGISQDTTIIVQTCKENSYVDALLRKELTEAQKTDRLNGFLIWGGPNGLDEDNVLDEASRRYNCHAYAYHVSEGKSNVWINNAGRQYPNECWEDIQNIAQYWADGCLIEVCNEADADKIHYYCGDHSAIMSSSPTTGLYDSKMGEWPLVTHGPTQVPYTQPASRHYYAKLDKISGSTSPLCINSSRTFSINNQTGVTYSWTKGYGLTFLSGTSSNSVTVKATSAGQSWVEVEVNSPCSSISVTKRVELFIGEPLLIDMSLEDASTEMPIWEFCLNEYN